MDTVAARVATYLAADLATKCTDFSVATGIAANTTLAYRSTFSTPETPMSGCACIACPDTTRIPMLPSTTTHTTDTTANTD